MRLGSMTWKCALLVGLSLGVVGCSSMSQHLAQFEPSGRNKTDSQLTMARMHEKQGQWAKSREIYQQILQRQPDHVVACHRLGIMSARLGDYESAAKYLLDALDRSPGNSEILTDLGYVAYLQDDSAAAEEALKQALAADAGNKRAANNLALVLGREGRIDESYAMFRRVVSEAEANANLGFVHTLRGEGQLALNRYSRSLSLNSKLTSSSQAMVELAQLHQKLPDGFNRPDATGSAPTAVAAVEKSKPTQAAYEVEPAKAQVVQCAKPGECEGSTGRTYVKPVAAVTEIASENASTAKQVLHQVANSQSQNSTTEEASEFLVPVVK